MNSRPQLIVPVVVSLTVSLAMVTAQTQTTLPPGYETTLHGSYSASAFGASAQHRHQFADGTFPFPTNQQAVQLLRVDYRLDHGRVYSSKTSTGRSWSNVTLSMAECDYQAFGLTWSNNVMTTPTVVYNAATTWPTVSGQVLDPQWGKEVSFGFTQPWAWRGKNTLLFDFVFRDGKLANSAAWGSQLFYYLDAAAAGDYVTTLAEEPIPTPGAQPVCGGAEFVPQVWLWGPGAVLTPNTYSARLAALNIENGASLPVLFAIAGKGNRTGVAVGAQCHRLHLDPASIAAVLTVSNAPGGARLAIPHKKYHNQFAGLDLWFQAAWNGAKGFSLTRANHVQVDLLPRDYPRRFASGSTTSSTASSWGSWPASHPTPRVTWR